MGAAFAGRLAVARSFFPFMASLFSQYGPGIAPALFL
nr:MAG TPA: hypothetical protein [Caudoviricetes sp.]